MLAAATSAVADEVYLREADAPAAVFPQADRFERGVIRSTPELRAHVATKLGKAQPSLWEASYPVVSAFRGSQLLGHAIQVEEICKHRPITLVVGVDRDGKVCGVALMVYREAYGGEVRSRRFLEQYRGKGASDPLLPSQDIRNISGATLSARAVGRGVKKAIAVLEEGAGAVSAPDSDARPAGGETSSTPQDDRSFVREAQADSPVRMREAHYVMGTILDLTVDAPSAAVGRDWVRRAVAEARLLDAELTSFDAASALSQLNRRAGEGFVRVSPDLYRVLALSKDLAADTGGKFDVTVSPLVTLWGHAASENRLPSAAALGAARAAVGADKLLLRAPDEAAIPRGAALEIGGIGKGYAADRIAELLRWLGATSALVNFGESSLVAVGPPAGEPAWPIWIRRGEALDGPLRLRNMALSTSGSFAQRKQVAGRTIGHIIDPRSGEPLRREAQATVVAPTGAEAEAWSKALLVDPAGSFAALSSSGVRGGLLIEGTRVRQTSGLAALGAWRTAAR